MVRRVPLILASASPRRRRLMASFPWPVRVRPSRVPEPQPRPGVSPREYVRDLAALKARSVASSLKEGLVLGADTVVYHGGRIWGKPSSTASARRMLASLAGRWHRVYTGLALVARPGGREWRVVWSTEVRMRALSPEKLDFWSARNHDKAGAYAAQERRNPFVEGLRGDYDNVVGLPRRGVRRLLAQARKAGFIPR